jgi:hypothetical protein
VGSIQQLPSEPQVVWAENLIGIRIITGMMKFVLVDTDPTARDKNAVNQRLLVLQAGVKLLHLAHVLAIVNYGGRSLMDNRLGTRVLGSGYV